MPRPLAVLLAAAAAAAMLLVPAPGASALPAAVVSTSTVTPGSSFTVSGTGCWDPDFDPSRHQPWEWNVFIVTGVPPGSVNMTAASGGAWSITLRVPPELTMVSGFSVEPFCRLSNGTATPYPQLWVGVPRRGAVPTAVAPPAPAAPSTVTTTAPRVPSPVPTPTSAPPPAPTTSAAPPPPPAAFSASPGCADCEKLTPTGPVTAGDELALSYSGFQPGEPVTLVMRSTPVELGTFAADTSGVVTADVTIPVSAEAGAHTLTLSGPVTGDRVLSFRLAAAEREDTPAAAPTDDADPTLPLVIGVAGLALLAVGGLALHRRRAARSANSPESGSHDQRQPTETPIAEPIA